VTVASWDPATNTASNEVPAGTRSVDLHSRTFTVRVPLAALGRQGAFAFDFYAVHRGIGEDWLRGSRVDLLPDNAAGPCGGSVLGVRPAEWSGLPETWSLTVPGDGSRRLARLATPGGSRVPALLLMLPDNRFEVAGLQDRAVTLGATPEPPRRGGCLAYLPAASRHDVLKRSEADALIGDGMDLLARQQWVKAEHYHTDARDPAVDARRSYRFNGGIGMRYTFAPLASEWMWDRIRVGDKVYVMRHQLGTEGPWGCGSVDEWTVFWPEYAARLRTTFPTYGWRIEQRGTPAEPNTWQLRHALEPAVGYFAKVDKPSGLILLLTRTDTATGRRDVFTLLEFGVVNIGLSKPPGIVCP
jgi:hypothetical protein